MVIYSLCKGDKTYIVTPSWEGAIKAKSYLKSRDIRATIKTNFIQEK